MSRVGVLWRTVTVILTLVAAVANVQAQDVVDRELEDADQPPASVAPRPPVVRPALRVFFAVDATEMTATRTFDAVLGRSRIVMPGGGAEALHVWRGLFLRGAFSSTEQTGSRVVVTDDGEVVSLGIPVTIVMTPLEFAAGWRWSSTVRSRLVPYVGGGLLAMRYRETSEFAGDDDDTDGTYPGAVAFAGIEAGLWKGIVAGVEAQYRTVKDVIGSGGVSAVFDEDDLGGITVRVLVGFRR